MVMMRRLGSASNSASNSANDMSCPGAGVSRDGTAAPPIMRTHRILSGACASTGQHGPLCVHALQHGTQPLRTRARARVVSAAETLAMRKTCAQTHQLPHVLLNCFAQCCTMAAMMLVVREQQRRQHRCGAGLHRSTQRVRRVAPEQSHLLLSTVSMTVDIYETRANDSAGTQHRHTRGRAGCREHIHHGVVLHHYAARGYHLIFKHHLLPEDREAARMHGGPALRLLPPAPGFPAVLPSHVIGSASSQSRQCNRTHWTAKRCTCGVRKRPYFLPRHLSAIAPMDSPRPAWASKNYVCSTCKHHPLGLEPDLYQDGEESRWFRCCRHCRVKRRHLVAAKRAATKRQREMAAAAALCTRIHAQETSDASSRVALPAHNDAPSSAQASALLAHTPPSSPKPTAVRQGGNKEVLASLRAAARRHSTPAALGRAAQAATGAPHAALDGPAGARIRRGSAGPWPAAGSRSQAESSLPAAGWAPHVQAGMAPRTEEHARRGAPARTNNTPGGRVDYIPDDFVHCAAPPAVHAYGAQAAAAYPEERASAAQPLLCSPATIGCPSRSSTSSWLTTGAQWDELARTVPAALHLPHPPPQRASWPPIADFIMPAVPAQVDRQVYSEGATYWPPAKRQRVHAAHGESALHAAPAWTAPSGELPAGWEHVMGPEAHAAVMGQPNAAPGPTYAAQQVAAAPGSFQEALPPDWAAVHRYAGAGAATMQPLPAPYWAMHAGFSLPMQPPPQLANIPPALCLHRAGIALTAGADGLHPQWSIVRTGPEVIRVPGYSAPASEANTGQPR